MLAKGLPGEFDSRYVGSPSVIKTGNILIMWYDAETVGLDGKIGLAYKILNNSPEADAGDDQTVDANSDCTGTVTLNGSGSTDADSTPGTNDDIVSFAWYENGVLLGSEETLEHEFSLGEHTVTLVVIDSADVTDSDDTRIIVEDNTPPEIDAAFVRVCEDKYRIEYSAYDNCTVSPTILKAFIKACGRKFHVTYGQMTEYEPDDDCEVEWDDGILEIEGSNIFLKVVGIDDSGNKNKTKVFPPLKKDDDQDDS